MCVMISFSLVTHKGCRDHSSSCKDWAKNGDCMNKPVFMTAFCRWTCKHCAKKSGKGALSCRNSKISLSFFPRYIAKYHKIYSLAG